MKRQQISRLELASYLLSPSLFVMVTLMVVEAMLAAMTTWLVINAGRKVAVGQFLLSDLIWILAAQSASYVVGVISWIFAERAGYRGFGKFMLRFARENRGKVKLLNEKPAREQVEPFGSQERLRIRDQIAMRDHHTFRQRRAARRVLQETQVIGIHRG